MRDMLSMLPTRQRVVMPVREWFRLPTKSGGRVQAADIALSLTGLPWTVAYDETLDAFVLTKAMTERIFIRWQSPTQGRVFYGAEPPKEDALYVRELREADLLRLRMDCRETLDTALLRTFPFNPAEIETP